MGASGDHYEPTTRDSDMRLRRDRFWAAFLPRCQTMLAQQVPEEVNWANVDLSDYLNLLDEQVAHLRRVAEVKPGSEKRRIAITHAAGQVANVAMLVAVQTLAQAGSLQGIAPLVEGDFVDYRHIHLANGEHLVLAVDQLNELVELVRLDEDAERGQTVFSIGKPFALEKLPCDDSGEKPTKG